MKYLVLLFLSTALAAQPAAPRSQAPRTPPPPYINTLAATGPHQAVLNWSNASCTSNAICTLQAYRATCTSPSNCPTYSAGSSAWKVLDMSANLVTTPGASGTTWQYVDKDTALQDSTTYVWVATNSYSGASTASPASSNYSGTTNNGTPPAPTTASSGNSVN